MHMDGTQFNPVKGYMRIRITWLLSSFCHCLTRGLIPSDEVDESGEAEVTDERR